jgi:hypothetical protein
VTRSFTSAHLFEARIAVIRTPVETAARYQMLVAGAALEAPALVIEELRTTAEGPPETFLVMEKLEDGWSYLQLDGQGRPVDTRIDLCQRCHAEGLTDAVFGVGEYGLEAAPSE